MGAQYDTAFSQIRWRWRTDLAMADNDGVRVAARSHSDRWRTARRQMGCQQGGAMWAVDCGSARHIRLVRLWRHWRLLIPSLLLRLLLLSLLLELLLLC